MASGSRRNSASCAHRATWTCWQLASSIVRSSDCKGGHELLNISLAERTVHVGLLVHHQFVKCIFTVIAVIFEDWHNNPPHLLGICIKIMIGIQEFKSLGHSAWGKSKCDAAKRGDGELYYSYLRFNSIPCALRLVPCACSLMVNGSSHFMRCSR